MGCTLGLLASPSTPGALLSSSECEKYITGPIQSQIPHYIHRDEHEHATECQTCLPYVRDDTMATFRGSFLDATASTSFGPRVAGFGDGYDP